MTSRIAQLGFVGLLLVFSMGCPTPEKTEGTTAAGTKIEKEVSCGAAELHVNLPYNTNKSTFWDITVTATVVPPTAKCIPMFQYKKADGTWNAGGDPKQPNGAKAENASEVKLRCAMEGSGGDGTCKFTISLDKAK
jgi:hypothetical protein